MPRRRLNRTESREQTRRRLLEAAERVVARRGFDRASIEEIVQAAGLTTGAVYSNFEGRDDLLVHVLAERQRRQAKPTGTLSGDTAAERIQSLGRLFAAADDPQGMALVGSVDLLLFALRCPPARELVDAKVREGLGELAELLTGAGEADQDALELATAVVAYFLGLLELRALLGRQTVNDELFSRIARLASVDAEAMV